MLECTLFHLVYPGYRIVVDYVIFSLYRYTICYFIELISATFYIRFLLQNVVKYHAVEEVPGQCCKITALSSNRGADSQGGEAPPLGRVAPSRLLGREVAVAKLWGGDVASESTATQMLGAVRLHGTASRVGRRLLNKVCSCFCIRVDFITMFSTPILRT